MSRPAPVPPTHLLRLHSQPINGLVFSEDNERLYSGDKSGLVVVTSTRTLRAIVKWQAHTDGLLGVEEWGNEVITHGRDNKLHIWSRITDLPDSFRLGDTAAHLDLPEPELHYSLDVNALNYCRFSMMLLKTTEDDKKALIALPGLIDSSVADVWSLPSKERIHAAVGQEIKKSIFSTDPKGRNNAGIIMSMHLFTSEETETTETGQLRLLCAYENGSVTLRKYSCTDQPRSVEGTGWDILWTSKLHAETIMAMRVSKRNDFAITVSADHLIGRYDITKAAISSTEKTCIAFRTKYPGNSSIAIRNDSKVCAIGGWDGSIRLYAMHSMKPLGTLKYHKSNCQVVEFAQTSINGVHTPPHQCGDDGTSVDEARNDDDGDDEESDEDMTKDEKMGRERWLVGGGKDNRVSIWSLISFSKKDGN